MYLCVDENIIDNVELKPQEVYLLLCLIRLADDNGELVISAKDLMKSSRFTNKAMMLKYLENLISSGYIKKILIQVLKRKHQVRWN